MNIQNLVLDINKKCNQVVTANVGEVDSRLLKISIIDNGIPVDLTEVTVYLYAKKPDNTKVFNTVKVEDAKQGLVLVEITNQVLAIEGFVKLTLLLTKDKARLASKIFTLKVDETIVDDEALESSNEFKALDLALDKVDEWNGYFEETSGKIEEKYAERLNNVSSQLAHNANDINIFKTEKINVFDFGAKGDGVTDDTQAIKDAIAYAQSHPSKTIFLPKTNASYLISDTINFYRMNVECPATIKVGFNGIGIIAGSSSSLAENYTIYINNITHTNYIDGDISVRVQGSKRLKFTFGTMQKLQIYANGNNTINSSVAYCQFNLIGNIAILELLGENSMGWINENTFYKGRMQNVIISGNYSHNKNVFFDSCIEGGNITINNGICNKFINIRNENLQSIYFAPSTHHNIVELSYYSAAANAVTRGTVTDYGVSNCVIDPEDCFASVEFLNMDAYNCKLLEGSHTSITVNEDTFALGSWNYVTTVYIPYKYAKRILVHANTDNGTRINVAVLDSNKNVVPTQHVQCMGTSWDSANSCLASSVNSKASYQIVGDGIKDGVDLAYIRVKVYTGNQKVTFNRINITVRCNPVDIPYINMAKPRINYNKLLSTTE